MPIVGFNFDKLLVEKKSPIKSSIRVKNDIGIKTISEQSVDIGNKKENILRLNFEFTSDYQPNIGNIHILGHILYLEKQSELKKILDDWKKNKKISQELTAQLLNTVLIKCNIKALNLTQEVNLPPHIRMSTISPRVKNDYIG